MITDPKIHIQISNSLFWS